RGIRIDEVEVAHGHADPFEAEDIQHAGLLTPRSVRPVARLQSAPRRPAKMLTGVSTSDSR
ncbi:MAG TPA: hypothetical protein VGF54_08715, partial [Streptosporangiaceae bacterium]